MDLSKHDLSTLFAQLGLDNNPVQIELFINKHKGIPAEVKLADAEFWSTSQQSFLIDAINRDSSWSEIVDVLDSLLR